MSLSNELLPSVDDFVYQALELIQEANSAAFGNQMGGDPLVVPHEPLLDVPLLSSLQFGSDDSEHSVEPTTSRTNHHDGLNAHKVGDSTRPPRRVNKRRIEIHQLRQRVHQLEQRLEMLRGKRPPLGEASRASTRMWHAIAAAELENLKTTEDENLRLRKLLQEYKHIDRQLRRRVSKNFKSMESILVPSSKITTVNEMSPLIQNPELFPLLLDSIWGMQLRTDSILASQQLPIPHGMCREVNTELANGTDISIQVVDSRVIPFPYSSVVAATWRQSFELDGINSVAWEDLGGQTFQGRLNTHADICMFSGSLQGKVVMRRTDESHRVIIIRSGQYVCGESAHSCHPIWNQQWMVVSKLPSHLTDPNTACQLTMYDISLHMMLPARDLSTPMQNERLANLARAYAESATQRLEKVKETIDTLLLLHRC